MGCAELTGRSALRVGVCADNTAEDVDALLAGLPDGLKELPHIYGCEAFPLGAAPAGPCRTAPAVSGP